MPFSAGLNSMLITSEEAKYTDLAEIASLNIQLQIDEGSRPLSQEQAEQRLTKWLNQDYRCYLFLNNNVRVGYVLFRPTDNDSEGHPEGFYIRQFMITSEHRGQGLGTAAFEHFASYIAGNAPIILEVLISNPIARKFWTSVGFNEYSIKCERLPG